MAGGNVVIDSRERYGCRQSPSKSSLVPAVDAALLITITVAHSLPTQKIIVGKIAPAELAILEFPVSFKVSRSESIPTLLANDPIADNSSTSKPRTPTVPTAVARVVTIHKSTELLVLAPPSSLSGADCRQRRQQKKTRDH
jgi:hypothetical protein